jgi:hypothetical protein
MTPPTMGTMEAAEGSAPIWVRVGGGLVEVPGGRRHGPADAAFPPPGGPWEVLRVGGELVGWTPPGRPPQAPRRALEERERIVRECRAWLLERLGHKLRSSVLALQESARQAAFGRQELLAEIYEQALDVGRRAQALEAVALDPKDLARAVVLGAVLNLAAPGAVRRLPPEAVVRASEPALVEALTRAYEWMGGPGTEIEGVRAAGWWRLQMRAAPNRGQLPVPELGEPLVRLLVDVRLEGWLEATGQDAIVIHLPAA